MLFRFKLTYSGDDTTVAEPKGWINFKSEVKRDFNAHGSIYKFTSGTLKLGFAGGGRTVLEAAFQNDGFGAVVTFTADKRASTSDAWTNIFTGDAVMENRELNRDYFEVDFEVATFQQTLKNRMKTKVKLDSLLDLDGNALSGAITSYSGEWNGGRSIVIYKADFRDGGSSTNTTTYSKSTTDSAGVTPYQHLMVNFHGELISDFQAWRAISEQYNDGQLGNNSGLETFGIVSSNPGDLTLTGTFKYRYYGTFTTTIPGNHDIHLRFYYRHEDVTGTLISQTQCFIKTITTDGTSPYAYNSGVLTGSFTEVTFTGVAAGDRIILYIETQAGTGGTGSDVQTNDANIVIYYNSQMINSMNIAAETHTVGHYLTHDVLERIVYILTGIDARVNSSFFGLTDHGYASDGCGGLTGITSGGLLRQLFVNVAPEISLQDLLTSLKAMYGIGWAVENTVEVVGSTHDFTDIDSTGGFVNLNFDAAEGDVSGQYSVGDKVLIVAVNPAASGTFTVQSSVWSGSIVVLKMDEAFIVNTSGNVGVLGDLAYRIRVELMEYFYTDNEIIDLGNPVNIKEGESYNESTFDKLSFNTVQVGYSKFSNDEDLEGNVEDFLTRSEYVLPIKSIEGSYSQISNLITSGNLIQATYDAKSKLTNKWKYDDSVFFVALARSASTFIPEYDENFESIAGVTDESTTMNLRLAPVYMLLNHALIINSVLMGRPLGDLIQNTSVGINKDFNATFNNYAACLLGDAQRLQRSAAGNITIGDNFSGLRLFDPIIHKFTVALTTAQFTTIIDAMENNGTNNYGYLTYRDNEGVVQTGYLMDMKWNPIEEIAQIETLEKADNYGI